MMRMMRRRMVVASFRFHSCSTKTKSSQKHLLECIWKIATVHTSVHAPVVCSIERVSISFAIFVETPSIVLVHSSLSSLLLLLLLLLSNSPVPWAMERSIYGRRRRIKAKSFFAWCILFFVFVWLAAQQPPRTSDYCCCLCHFC